MDDIETRNRMERELDALIASDDLGEGLLMSLDTQDGLSVPSWTCTECAEDYGGVEKEGYLASWHLGYCDVCKQEKLVTEPKDYWSS